MQFVSPPGKTVKADGQTSRPGILEQPEWHHYGFKDPGCNIYKDLLAEMR